jgi:two-component system KDP operon response regulator KdpE
VEPEDVRDSRAPTLTDDVTILVVEDDPAVAHVLAAALRARGYGVRVAATGRAALDGAWNDQPDVVVLDLGLPDADGIDVCRAMRTWFPNPIIVLSADGAEDRKIAALEEGADDYVTKPFSMPEFMARLRVALRHRKLVASVMDAALHVVGDVVLDTGARTVEVAGRPVDLTRKEFSLFTLLARQPGRVLTHRTIIQHVWGETAGDGTSSLRVHVTQLRKKIGQGPERPRILTEPGVGYRLVVPPAGMPTPDGVPDTDP